MVIRLTTVRSSSHWGTRSKTNMNNARMPESDDIDGASAGLNESGFIAAQVQVLAEAELPVLYACTLTSLSTLHRSPSPSPVALRAESQLTGPKERCAKACPSTISLSTTPEAPATPRDTLQCTTATRARERGAATICPAWPWMLLRT